MRIATYNTHDCVGRDGRYSPGRIVDVLAELDTEIIALQEITLVHGGGFSERFAKALGMRVIDGTLFDRGGGRFGNVVLSRYPVVDHHIHDLSIDRREPRGAVDTVLDTGECRVRVCTTHLGLASRERKLQIRRLYELIGAGNGPTVLLGDFNVWRYTSELTPFASLGFRHLPVRSFPTWRVPLAALDRIFAGPPAVVRRCWRHDTPRARVASDHFPVLAEIAIDATADSNGDFRNR